MRHVDPIANRRSTRTLHRALVESVEPRLLLSAATLDDGFGDHGTLVIPAPGDDYIHAAQVLPGGKTLLAGSAGNSEGDDVLLMRLMADGSPDPSFGTGGRTVIDLGSPADAAYAMAVQPDGRIVLAGQYQQFGANFDFAVMRFNPDGTLDSTFGDGGVVLTDLEGSYDQALAVAVTPDGIVAAGLTINGQMEAAAIRLDAGGQPDSSFGNGGVAMYGKAGFDVNANSLAVTSAGQLLLGATVTDLNSYNPDTGMVNSDFGIIRLNADGTPDTGFGTGGMVTVDMGNEDDALGGIALGAGDAIWAVGGSGDNFAVLKLDAMGNADPSFSGDGKLSLDFGGNGDFANALAVMPDGSLFVSGRSGPDLALASILADGTLDSSFTATGQMTLDLGGLDEAVLAMSADASAMVLAGYTADADADVAAVRFLFPSVGHENQPPTVTLSGDEAGVRGQARNFAATAVDADGDALEIAWDFGDGQTVDFHPTTDVDALAPSHVFATKGTFAVTATVRDVAGATSTVSMMVSITPIALQADSLNPGQTNLVVGGTEGNDVIFFIQNNCRGKSGTSVLLDGQKYGPFNFNGRIIAFGQSGNDLIAVKGSNKTGPASSRGAGPLLSADGQSWTGKGHIKHKSVGKGVINRRAR